MDEVEVRNARSALDYLPEINILEDIHKRGSAFFLKISIEISELDDEFIPTISHWYIWIPDDYHIRFYPANEQSVIVTYKHQEFNAEIAGKPYRAGYPCLIMPLHGMVDKYAIKGSPFNKFLAYSRRMLEWLRDAATDNLSQDRQPFEVPTNEFKADFIYKGCYANQWGYFDYKCGFASVDKIYSQLILRTICDLKCEEYNSRVFWGDLSNQFEKNTESAIWIKLNEFPVKKPWMYPQTWEELFTIGKEQGTDVIGQIMRLLSVNNFQKITYLFFVFPIPKNYGETADYLYWLMCDLPAFGQLPSGFRKNNAGRSNYYKNKFKGKIIWYRPKNWDNINLLARGAMDVTLQDLHFAIIGAGAIGSVVLEELSRMGARYISIFDGDKFVDGNISRHTLSLRYSGIEKAKGVKYKLEENNPSIEIKAENFLDETNIELLKNSDVIIDCTADNDVITLLGNKQFAKQKYYFIGAISYGAKDLIVYSDIGNQVDSKMYFQSTSRVFNDRTKDVTHDNMTIDGIGCYHPVFPARCDDIYMWASIFVKQIITELENGKVYKKIDKYTIQDDLSIKREEINDEKIP